MTSPSSWCFSHHWHNRPSSFCKGSAVGCAEIAHSLGGIFCSWGCWNCASLEFPLAFPIKYGYQEEQDMVPLWQLPGWTWSQSCGQYQLPSLLDFSFHLHSCTFFSVVELIKGYHPIPMATENITKTAILTSFELFVNLLILFSLKNAAQSFQRLMYHIFHRLPFVFSYVNDHWITNTSKKEHLQHKN